MMGFIDHEEVESIPQPVHVPVLALEGGLGLGLVDASVVALAEEVACAAWPPATCVTSARSGSAEGAASNWWCVRGAPIVAGSDGIPASRPRSSVGRGTHAASGVCNVGAVLCRQSKEEGTKRLRVGRSQAGHKA